MLVAVLLHDRVSLIDRGFRKVRHIFHPRDSPIPPRWLPAYARLARHRARFAEERTWSRRWAAWACSLGRGVFGETGASSARGVMGEPGYGLVGDWGWFRALGSRSRSLRARPSQG
jgi:hypothetical protein